MTDQEYLELIDKAIERILLYGQSTEVDGKTYTEANLADLQKSRTDVQRRISSQSSRMTSSNRFVPMRTKREYC